MNHFYIVIICQSFLKNREKISVNLYRNNFACRLCQILCHRSDTRTDLQNHIILCHTGPGNDLVQNMSVNQEILSELLLKTEFVFLYYLNRSLRIG